MIGDNLKNQKNDGKIQWGTLGLTCGAVRRQQWLGVLPEVDPGAGCPGAGFSWGDGKKEGKASAGVCEQKKGGKRREREREADDGNERSRAST